MYKVIIDKDFFNLDSPLSQGLVSGLKKLGEKGFILVTDNLNSKYSEVLKKIFLLENISISTDSKDIFGQFDGVFFVTACKTVVPKEAKENAGSAKTPDEVSSPLSVPVSVTVDCDSETNNFEKAVAKILTSLRTSTKERQTKETKIKISVNLDGRGKSNIKTGVGFFDHMLEQISKHANLDLSVNVDGDLFVDEHHTVEDTGITLGLAISEALGDKRGIKRYGFLLPMDESVAKCALDLGGRSLLNFKCKFKREKVGDFPTELTEEFFRGLASGLKANIYLRAKGKNDHHKIEALFKAFAKSLNEALRMDERTQNTLPSTKGLL
jgi:imidazoleglycerol-phosphate dehydratase/histidinol-phosphatase